MGKGGEIVAANATGTVKPRPRTVPFLIAERKNSPQRTTWQGEQPMILRPADYTGG